MNNGAYGELWLVDYSPSLGHEYQKVRPAVIISPDKLLKKSNLFTCIAVSSKTTKALADDIILKKTGTNNLVKDSVLKMEHITTFDKKRLHKYIGKIDQQTLITIKNKLIQMYELS